MGVENAVSIAPAVSIGSGSFNPAEFAPISSISAIDPNFNEGPVLAGDISNSAPLLENSMPTTETPVPAAFLDSFADHSDGFPGAGGIRFAPEPVTVSSSEVSHPTSQVSLGSETTQIVEQTRPAVLQAAGMTQVKESLKNSLRPEVRLVLEPSQAIRTTAPEAVGLVEEVIEEKLKIEEEEQEATDVHENEEVKKLRIVQVEAEEVSRRREEKIVEAGQKAYAELQAEAKDRGVEVAGIDGQRVEKFLTFQEEDISPMRRGKGTDGTLEPTSKEVTSGFFKSVGDLKTRAAEIVLRNRPGKWAKEGKILKAEEVAKVEDEHIFKPGRSKAEIIIRIVKRRVESINGKGNTPVSIATVETKEEGPRIEDMPELAEVFKVAA